jgi:hypothetical protein
VRAALRTGIQALLDAVADHRLAARPPAVGAAIHRRVLDGMRREPLCLALQAAGSRT